MFGTVRAAGWEYSFSKEDLHWASVACLGEHPDDAEMVVWCMVQRLCLLRRSRKYPTLASLLLAYSQPINPGWRRDGWACRVGGPYHGSNACAAPRLARRDEYARMTLDDVRARWPGLVERVIAVMDGDVPNPVARAVHFAIPSKVTKSVAAWADTYGHGDTSRLILARGHNWFHAVPGTMSWADDFVRIVKSSTTDTRTATASPWTQDDYLKVQWLLVALGYDLGTYGKHRDGVDGDFGDASRRALLRFELDHGLDPDGVPDLISLDELWTQFTAASGTWPAFDRNALDARAGAAP